MDMDPVYKFGGTHNESKTSKMAADNLAFDEELMPKKTQGLSLLDHHRLLQKLPKMTARATALIRSRHTLQIHGFS
jgi:hypothetical protein